jgi:outer membrane autotransporter protein
MAAVASTLNAAQTDLLNRCTQLIATGIQLQSGGATVPSSSLGLSSSQLAGVLGTLSQQQAIAQGSNAVEAAPNQARIVSRLVALRRGAGSQIIAGGKEFNLSGKGSRTGQALVPTLTGGGASADQASPGRLGLWLNGDGSFGDADTTQNQVGYSYHTAGLTAGADYRLTDNLVLGAAFNYLRTNATFVSTLGTADSQGYGGVLYGTYYIGGFHLDLNGGFTWNNYDITRNIVYAGVGPSFTVVNRTATGSPSGQEYNINFGLGYDFAVKGFTLTPYLRVEYLNLVTESYTETGALGLNLQVVGQRVQSLLTVLGGQVSYAWSVPFGVLSPYVRAEWRHEFLNDPRSITAQFVNDPFGTSFLIPTDSPTRNYADVGAGVSAQFAKGISAFLSFDTILGLSNFTNYQFVGGLRFELF